MRRFPFLLAAVPLLATALFAQPTRPSARQLETLRAQSAQVRRPAAVAEFSVNTSSREDVRQFYRAVYGASDGVAMSWTGDYATGAAGDTSSLFKEAVRLRINFFRALVGVPAVVTLNSTFNAKAQQAALMMSANSDLSHSPPTSWTFYTAEGAEAASNSNLAIGSAGPDAITGYMGDSGSNNTGVGHRRWLIYPQTREMGTGDVPGNETLRPANATWIVDANSGGTRPTTRTTAVPYPEAGFIPYNLVWPRWSFTYPGADFTSATVTMTHDGQNVPVQLEPLDARNIGEPTLVWVYGGLDPAAETIHVKPTTDTTYTVAVNNVQVSGAPQSFTYNVTVFDPDLAGPDYVPVSVSGPTTLAVGVASTFPVVRPTFASSFDWRSLQLAAFTKTYGAENGLEGVEASVASDYLAVQNGVVGVGTATFRLAHPVRTNQTLTLPQTFYVGANAAVTFLSRLGFSTTDEVARVQVSSDDGGSWVDVYAQAGTNGNGESGFATRTASLAAFANRTVHLRFNYTVTPTGFIPIGTDNGVGWYIDNIALTGVQNAAAAPANSVVGGSAFSFTPSAAGTIGLQARGVLFGAYPMEWGPVASVTAVSPPTVTLQPANKSVAPGASATLGFAASGATSVRWQRNGIDLAGGSSSSFTINNVQPDTTGLYVAVASNGAASVNSAAAIVGVNTTSKVIGSGEELQPVNIPHPNGNIFDQVLLNGVAETITADPGQVTRTSYIDLDDDIVQVEFSGAGTLSLVLESPSGPALPTKYNQSIEYMKGHAGIVITGADESTNVSVFSVGRITAVNQALFKTEATYDGIADIAFIAIASKNGKFGGVRTSNANYFAAKGLTGVYAPGVAFQGPVFIGDVVASDAGTPVIVLGSASDTRITGGDMEQANGKPVQVSGIAQLKFTPGGDSHGNALAAQANRAVYQQGGADVTAQIVVNP